jgi:hypothetical protein
MTSPPLLSENSSQLRFRATLPFAVAKGWTTKTRSPCLRRRSKTTLTTQRGITFRQNRWRRISRASSRLVGRRRFEAVYRPSFARAPKITLPRPLG